MKDTIKLMFKGLGENVISLIISVILLTASAFSISSSFVLKEFNLTEFVLRNRTGGDEYAYLRFSQYKEDGHYKDRSFDDETLEKIRNYTSNNAVECYDFSYKDAINLTPVKGKGYEDINKFLDKHNCVMKLDQETGEEKAQIHRCEKLSSQTSCRLPNKSDEIAINALAAYSMLAYGVITETLPDTGMPSTIYKPKNLDELIGLKLYNGLTITGIYSSNDGYSELFEPYLCSGLDEKEGDYLTKYYLYKGFSSSGAAYVSKEFIEEKELKNPKFVFAKLSGNYASDLKFVESFTDENGSYLYPLNKYTGYASYFDTTPIYHDCYPVTKDQFWRNYWYCAIAPVTLSFAIALYHFFRVFKKDDEEKGILETSVGKRFINAIFQMMVPTLFSWALALIAIQIILLAFNAHFGIAMLVITPAIVFSALAISFIETGIAMLCGLGISKIPFKKKKEG